MAKKDKRAAFSNSDEPLEEPCSVSDSTTGARLSDFAHSTKLKDKTKKSEEAVERLIPSHPNNIQDISL